MKLFLIISFVICTSVLLGRSMAASPITNTTSYNVSDIIGIDISKYQGTVNFEEIKAAGIRYVLIRATEGITYQDAEYTSNYTSANAAGITIGAYHFYETNDDPIAQLRNFTNIVTLKPGDLPPVVDIERLHNQDEAKLAENIQIFLDGVELHYGAKPIIYSGLNFSNKYLTGFGDYPLWLAEYKVDEPKLPKGWTNWTFWQWSQSDTIIGINGKVDADRYNGNEASFRNMLIK